MRDQHSKVCEKPLKGPRQITQRVLHGHKWWFGCMGSLTSGKGMMLFRFDSQCQRIYLSGKHWVSGAVKMLTKRVPDSLQEELLGEFGKEGVDPNRLCLTKLANPPAGADVKMPERGMPEEESLNALPRAIEAMCLNVPVAFHEETERWE